MKGRAIHLGTALPFSNVNIVIHSFLKKLCILSCNLYNDIVETIVAHYDKQYGAYTVETLAMVWEGKKSKIELIHLTEEVIFLTFTSNGSSETTDI